MDKQAQNSAQTNPTSAHHAKAGGDDLDIKGLVIKIISFWPFIVASTVLALAIAFTVNRYARDIFRVKAVIHLKENENPIMSDNISLAFNWGGASDLVQSHIAILQSFTHNLRVAKKLGWEVSYYGAGRVKEQEQYGKNLFYRVEWDTLHPQAINLPFQLEFQAGQFKLDVPEEENFSVYNFEQDEAVDGPRPQVDGIPGTYPYGSWIETDWCKFRIWLNDSLPDAEGEHYFVFQSYMSMPKRLKKH
jgi:Chain length determinant protein.